MARDVLIIGGGAIGSAIACFLARRDDVDARILVLERDPTYRTASSALSASSIRQQFSTPLNIALSRFGLELLRRPNDHLAVDAADLGLREAGYLILAGHGGAPALAEMHTIQRHAAVDVELLTPAELADRLPWLNLDGIAAGSLGRSGEGWFDGYGLLQALRRTARALGVRYLTEEVVGLERRGRRLEAALLRSGDRLAGDLFINAAGPWGAAIAGFAGIDLPVRARRRTVYVFDCRTPPPEPLPLVADPSGLWFRPEGALWLAGTSPRAGQPDPDDLPLADAGARFEDEVWPLLAARVPAFEAIRQTGAWSGYYEVNTFDHNGIVGPHPEIDNLLFANGFSGHGLQHAAGIGRGLAEWIALGRYDTLDLTPLGFDRLIAGTPYPERNVI